MCLNRAPLSPFSLGRYTLRHSADRNPFSTDEREQILQVGDGVVYAGSSHEELTDTRYPLVTSREPSLPMALVVST
jgi:hypothetical protein